MNQVHQAVAVCFTIIMLQSRTGTYWPTLHWMLSAKCTILVTNGSYLCVSFKYVYRNVTKGLLKDTEIVYAPCEGNTACGNDTAVRNNQIFTIILCKMYFNRYAGTTK